MTPCAGSAPVLTRSSSVRRVACARSQSCTTLSAALLPSLSGSPRPAARPRKLLLTLLRAQFAPAVSLQSP
jgi:hypothetical protein